MPIEIIMMSTSLSQTRVYNHKAAIRHENDCIYYSTCSIYDKCTTYITNDNLLLLTTDHLPATTMVQCSELAQTQKIQLIS